MTQLSLIFSNPSTVNNFQLRLFIGMLIMPQPVNKQLDPSSLSLFKSIHVP